MVYVFHEYTQRYPLLMLSPPHLYLRHAGLRYRPARHLVAPIPYNSSPRHSGSFKAFHHTLHLHQLDLHVRQEANTLQQQPGQHPSQPTRTTETHRPNTQGISWSANAFKGRIRTLSFTATSQPYSRTGKRGLQLRNSLSITINQHVFPASTSCR